MGRAWKALVRESSSTWPRLYTLSGCMSRRERSQSHHRKMNRVVRKMNGNDSSSSGSAATKSHCILIV